MAIGVLAGIVLSNFFNFNPFVFIALAALGSLLPDVDHKNSTINRIFPITKIVPSFFEHRGFFHSVFP
ncbi:metal-dependent hydrolase, partial [Candidatus Woesearchaeota archaeon]